MYAREEQGFVDINIAHPGEKRLVQQQWFDLGLALAQAGGEFGQPNLERLGSQFAYACRTPLDPPELAGIIVEEHAPVEREDAVRVRGFCAVDEQLSGHPKVYSERPLIERDQDEFAAPLDRLNRAAGKFLG